ncbi:hypothetical protein OYT88_06170 [Sporolactobacillus sp. CQH2019]|uniref:hypothetical protein n=1 Tax=Sporolactobacillus sp. CQH2019 TaxID=3023512 RepID=UPI002368B5FC|nr:hypothetical protein [Sporolactobacillus sp. CQH2019]MDD9148132.1 hypothetical protein [Sporolactobacillus sp. CQH2019]
MAIENAAQANGVFRDMKDLERQRRATSESITKRKQALIDYCRTQGPTLVYNPVNDEDKPTMIQTVKRVTTKLDLSSLALNLNVAVSDMNAPGIAKLVEAGKLTAEDFEKYKYDEETYVLHQRKAHKQEIEQFRNKI